MIVARAPFRITLGGGGTDLPSFYRHEGGFVFAMSIDKYMYVMLNPTSVDRTIRLQYLQSEVVEHSSLLRHPLAREALRLHGIEEAMEITSMADLPARAGVGSSGSYVVALLTALRAYKRQPTSLRDLAEEACHIEIELLNEPVGKQDQYMAAFGGVTTLNIARDGTVDVRAVELSARAIHALVANTHLYYTGFQRSAAEILREQHTAALQADHIRHAVVLDNLRRIRDLGLASLEAITSEDFDEFGRLLDLHWQAKRRMSPKVGVDAVGGLYEDVKRRFAVLGGKLVGAGGGGFLMLYAPQRHREITDYMREQGMWRLHYAPEFQGAKVVADLRGSHELGVDHRRRSCEHS